MNLDSYDDVDSRIHAWHKAHPDGRITTRLEHHLLDERGGLVSAIVSAAVYRADGTEPAGTGLAQEQRADRGVNAVFLLENAETSAIGRALASAGYSTKGKRPSRQEMEKVAATQTTGGEAANPSPASAPAPGVNLGDAIANVKKAMPGSEIIDEPAPEPKRGGGAPTPATDRQKGMIRRLVKVLSLDPDMAKAYVADVLGKPVTFDELTKVDASKLIDALKADEAQQGDPANNPTLDDPWGGEA